MLSTFHKGIYIKDQSQKWGRPDIIAKENLFCTLDLCNYTFNHRSAGHREMLKLQTKQINVKAVIEELHKIYCTQ